MEAPKNEFADVSNQIVSIGGQLKAMRVKRDELNEEIGTLERELAPLVIKQQQLLAEITGVPMAPLAAVQAAPQPVPSVFQQEMAAAMPQPVMAAPAAPAPFQTGPAFNEQKVIETRILRYLKESEEDPDTTKGVSATHIAEVLKLDPIVVREVMFKLATGRR